MSLSNAGLFLALGQPPSPPGTTPDPRASALYSLGPLVLMVVIFYFLLIRPQQKKQKAHAEMLKNVKSGDRIVTSGGVLGTVITVKETSLTIRSADAKFEITKASVAEITERSGQPSES